MKISGGIAVFCGWIYVLFACNKRTKLLKKKKIPHSKINNNYELMLQCEKYIIGNLNVNRSLLKLNNIKYLKKVLNVSEV